MIKILSYCEFERLFYIIECEKCGNTLKNNCRNYQECFDVIVKAQWQYYFKNTLRERIYCKDCIKVNS